MNAAMRSLVASKGMADADSNNRGGRMAPEGAARESVATALDRLMTIWPVPLKLVSGLPLTVYRARARSSVDGSKFVRLATLLPEATMAPPAPRRMLEMIEGWLNDVVTMP